MNSEPISARLRNIAQTLDGECPPVHQLLARAELVSLAQQFERPSAARLASAIGCHIEIRRAGEGAWLAVAAGQRGDEVCGFAATSQDAALGSLTEELREAVELRALELRRLGLEQSAALCESVLAKVA